MYVCVYVYVYVWVYVCAYMADKLLNILPNGTVGSLVKRIVFVCVGGLAVMYKFIYISKLQWRDLDLPPAYEPMDQVTRKASPISKYIPHHWTRNDNTGGNDKIVNKLSYTNYKDFAKDISNLTNNKSLLPIIVHISRGNENPVTWNKQFANPFLFLSYYLHDVHVVYLKFERQTDSTY